MELSDTEVILSAAVSLDGCLDDCSPQRLKLSGAEDWDAVAELRAGCDAILVGAGTVRKDNPSLVIRDQERRRRRVAAGMEADIVKVTVTASGDLDPDAAFFREGAGRKVVFAPFSADGAKLRRLEACAEVIQADRITPLFIRDTLAGMGYRRLMVEGGTQMLSMFLSAGAADRMRLAVAPLIVGDPNAPRLVCAGRYPWDKEHRMELEGIEMLGDVAVMKYRMRR